MKDYRLRFLDGPLKGRQIPLRDNIAIGRFRDNDVVVAAETISRYHARILRNGDELVVQDLGSKNGTFINNQKISMLVLVVGDKVTFGDVNGEIVVGEGNLQISEVKSSEATSVGPEPSPSLENRSWLPKEGFLGYPALTKLADNPAGVFLLANSHRFGECEIFVYYPFRTADTPYKRLARYEAERRNNISVSGIPRLLEIGDEEGLLYLYYERAPGRSVQELTDEGKYLGAAKALMILGRGRSILKELSRAGVSHGALSSENVLIDDDSGAILSAFGVVLPDRTARKPDIDPLRYDIADLCGAAYVAASGRALPAGDHGPAALKRAKLTPTDIKPDVPLAISLVIVKGLDLGSSGYLRPDDFIDDVTAMEKGDMDRVAARLVGH
ncbi:MAG: serine/threonine-protein kinase [Candidatus Brocadiia bacterium]